MNAISLELLQEILNGREFDEPARRHKFMK